MGLSSSTYQTTTEGIVELSLKQIVVNGTNRWVVVVDGVPECTYGYGSCTLAYERMDELWAKRPQSDRTAEALWALSYADEF